MLALLSGDEVEVGLLLVLLGAYFPEPQSQVEGNGSRTTSDDSSFSTPIAPAGAMLLATLELQLGHSTTTSGSTNEASENETGVSLIHHRSWS